MCGGMTYVVWSRYILLNVWFARDCDSQHAGPASNQTDACDSIG
jgi:hypothetical protein